MLRRSKMTGIQDSIMRKLKIKNSTVFINITNRCNVKCRHCINIGGKTVLGEARSEEVINWIEKVAESNYKAINFVGGEPFLLVDDLRRYTQKADKLGLNPGVTTNGFFAKSEEEATDILNSLPALKKILISTDLYHLEYIDIKNIHNLIRASLKLKRFVAVNSVCANMQDGEKIKELFSEYKKVFVNISPVVRAGAANTLDRELEKFSLFQNPEAVSDFCGVRDHFVDCQGGVNACCMATLGLATKFLYLGNLNKDSFLEIIENKSNNAIYKLLEEKGPQGLLKLIVGSKYEDLFKNSKYTSECELCVDILNRSSCYEYILKSLTKKENTYET
ncbi:radical SAM protein [Clostridium sp. BNL1100]|uniref:radical SAM/SPASM domain-containing protein n=1 Tax=Clostridium sp. BNL1100 TaxID=755731 RepID=UPI00024A740D|nr:radical SAM protein [Clostridium sp. BNL1100]AEY67262.1 putative Fe-S oxidoreductase [Clostridium sp. BNL1100]